MGKKRGPAQRARARRLAKSDVVVATLSPALARDPQPESGSRPRSLHWIQHGKETSLHIGILCREKKVSPNKWVRVQKLPSPNSPWFGRRVQASPCVSYYGADGILGSAQAIVFFRTPDAVATLPSPFASIRILYPSLLRRLRTKRSANATGCQGGAADHEGEGLEAGGRAAEGEDRRGQGARGGGEQRRGCPLASPHPSRTESTPVENS